MTEPTLLAELARATALFQARAVAAHMGMERPEIHLTDDGVMLRVFVETTK